MDLSNIMTHYKKQWGDFSINKLEKGPVHELPKGFCVLKFAPTRKRNMWTYATCGMSQEFDSSIIELHMFSPNENDFIIELLTVVAHYHKTGLRLGLGHTVNFGTPWHKDSLCNYGMISLPYLDGPALEWLITQNVTIRFLWLKPITTEEVKFIKQNGLEALEELFDKYEYNYLDYFRKSVI